MNIVFLCHGNICRSPMAEYVFKYLIKKNNVSHLFNICSRATSNEENGNDIYPPAKKILNQKGIPYGIHRAKRITKEEYENADYILAMEEFNVYNLKHVIGNVDSNKVYLLRNWSNVVKDIEDPWYSGNFNKVFEEILEGCNDFLNFVLN